jgi:UDP-glucose 4-epimerase
MNEQHVVAGGAGFIGSTLVRVLLRKGASVLVLDDFSLGRRDYLGDLQSDPRLHIEECDVADRSGIEAALRRASSRARVAELWHMAANSDIPAGVHEPDVDYRKTFQTTYELLRACRLVGIDTFHFASSSAVYGDHGDVELHESIGPLLPISNYGAMKLASEAQLSAASEAFLRRANVFRFPNVVGTPATHGVILDFVRKLKSNPARLQVLGNGSQQKAYLHVSDLVDAMLVVATSACQEKVQLVNIGPVDAGVQVRWIAEQVVSRVSPGATIEFGSEGRGWLGDVPRFRYSVSKLREMGWAPRLDSEHAILRAIDEISVQEGF